MLNFFKKNQILKNIHFYKNVHISKNVQNFKKCSNFKIVHIEKFKKCSNLKFVQYVKNKKILILKVKENKKKEKIEKKRKPKKLGKSNLKTKIENLKKPNHNVHLKPEKNHTTSDQWAGPLRRVHSQAPTRLFVNGRVERQIGFADLLHLSRKERRFASFSDVPPYIPPVYFAVVPRLHLYRFFLLVSRDFKK
jgi:hypothetical protein